MRFQKREIRKVLERQERGYRLAILSSHWLRGGNQYAPSAAAEARSLQMHVAGRWISFAELGDDLEDSQRMMLVTGDFVANQLHALIRAPFELLSDYCEDFDRAQPGVGLRGRMRAEGWYWFAYAARNAVSHNFRYDFRGAVRERLPIRWRDVTLTADMDGQPISWETFAHRTGYELFVEMRAFAERLPEVVP